VAEIGREDLRAAVAAGLVTEAQAAGLAALADRRRGARLSDDEPFELFRGFSDIFVALGIALLFWGLAVLGSLAGPGPGLAMLAAALALAWALSEYLVRRRRMALPGLALAAGGLGVAWPILIQTGLQGPALTFAGTLWLAAFYLRFRVPAVLFLLGVSLLALIVALQFDEAMWLDNPLAVLDLARNPGLSLAILAFGLAAFAVAMAYDLRDPHRVTRLSACGFWLHLIAAPAIVNTLGYTLFSRGDATGYALLAVLLAVFALVALIVDRRSLLVAGLAYVAVLIGLALEDRSASVAVALPPVVLGAFVVAIGAAWTWLRARLMPLIPFRDRLPPARSTA
jgi:hypothetical protein